MVMNFLSTLRFVLAFGLLSATAYAENGRDPGSFSPSANSGYKESRRIPEPTGTPRPNPSVTPPPQPAYLEINISVTRYLLDLERLITFTAEHLGQVNDRSLTMAFDIVMSADLLQQINSIFHVYEFAFLQEDFFSSQGIVKTEADVVIWNVATKKKIMEFKATTDFVRRYELPPGKYRVFLSAIKEPEMVDDAKVGTVVKRIGDPASWDVDVERGYIQTLTIRPRLYAVKLGEWSSRFPQ